MIFKTKQLDLLLTSKKKMTINIVKVNYGIKGKKIGLLKEGFKDMDEEVARVVRQAALTLEEAGAEVSDVSLPIHNDGELFYII